ncbi:uncharacterized protein LOC128682636 isoform X2 [Plodia interpunctella]|uniref:uncharacterized protein LOC128682636 isoform X2 n=1 Tax=Plodia interpunctella TaxID=58824 RepID=UPI0023686F15|nr:uncharacterized protein LOC128682636 isoform X2 [Plodia interpunctella]
MAVTSDLIAHDEPGNTKLHPYLVALVRWCVSCLWSTANILIHRLLTAPPPIAAARRPARRAASTAHLDPEPRVHCVELHTPDVHTLDVIFVHGLYGSLENTWRQGDWRPKYKIKPDKIPLVDPSNTCKCEKETEFRNKSNHIESKIGAETFDVCRNVKITDDEAFVTEKFGLMDQVDIVDNYELQANFVRDLFKKECKNCDDNFKDKNITKVDLNDCECKTKEGSCEVGCGCVCDKCYSTCWPRDWIKLDYPEARVISVNYTSDPHLWRPLWVKGYKRLRLHERAEQMTRQLLALGVGQRPIIWVGHSKGGLFVKQIYCEAYEAYLKMQNEAINDNTEANNNPQVDIKQGIDNEEVDNHYNKNREQKIKYGGEIFESNDNIEDNKLKGHEIGEDTAKMTSNSDEAVSASPVVGLWRNSAGFMFYSVPHRGSPLADIKMPVTARSVELLEISKDCALVVSLQTRWLAASAARRPAVRSLVETARTLMAVLRLRIVSASSADAGIGALYGVSVDHREICKPSSRSCLLYTELMSLMNAALNKCQCQY